MLNLRPMPAWLRLRRLQLGTSDIVSTEAAIDASMLSSTRIVRTQAHFLPDANAYLGRRISEGKTKREAHRALRRFVIRAIWHLWQECLTLQTTNFGAAA